jgi:alternate signal-mediated exported protein
MNKFTKGAIATGAGIVLLLGGAGTFALWNDSASVSGGSIASGTLTIDQDGAGSWSDVSVSATPVAILDIDGFLVVPGDVIEFTQSFEVGATGDNLEATLDVDDTTIDWGAWDGIASADVTVNGGVAEITDANDGDVIVVTVTFTFPYDLTDQNATQGATVDLSDLEITLTQDLR